MDSGMALSATETYRPSGRVEMGPFVPLLCTGIFVAMVMAWVLWLTENTCYYFILTPFIVGLPVFGMVVATVHTGRCRNSVVGGVVGLLLLALFYFGYWVTSYALNVVRHGDEAISYVARAGGGRGLVGYFRYKCRRTTVTSTPGETPGKTKEHPDPFGAYLFYGIECCLLPLAGLMAGRSLARRVYYEYRGAWARSLDVRYAAADFPVIWQAVQTNDWPSIKSLARLPRLGGSAYSPSVTLKIEYLRGAEGEPVYVTLSGTNLGKTAAAKVAGATGFGGIGKTFVRQHCVDGTAARALAGVFPEIGAPAQAGSELRRALEEAGLKARALDGPDFRSDAARASSALVSAGGRHSNIVDLDRSLCLPADDNPKRALRSAAWFPLKLLGTTFLLFVLGLLILAFNEDDQTKRQRVPVLEITGIALLACGGIGMVFTLTGNDKLQTHRLLRRFAQRPGALFDAPHGRKTMLLKLEDIHTYHISKRCPEDIVVCLLDPTYRRVLLEGVSHRYVIRGADVTKLALLDQGPQGVVQINYRVGEGELAIALIGTGFGRAFAHHPLWAALGRKAARKRLKQFRQCFGVAAT